MRRFGGKQQLLADKKVPVGCWADNMMDDGPTMALPHRTSIADTEPLTLNNEYYDGSFCCYERGRHRGRRESIARKI